MKIGIGKLRCGLLMILLCASSCAGHNFVRPQPGEITVGVTREADVLQRFGKPFRTGVYTTNGIPLEKASYAWASGANSLVNGITPARAITFYFRDGVTVGSEFSSSFEADSTDFDVQKAARIKEGLTTRDQVLELMGPPGGEFIYPLLKQEGQRGLVYVYSATKGTAFNLSTSRKVLIVAHDQDGIVREVILTTSGPN